MLAVRNRLVERGDFHQAIRDWPGTDERGGEKPGERSIPFLCSDHRRIRKYVDERMYLSNTKHELAEQQLRERAHTAAVSIVDLSLQRVLRRTHVFLVLYLNFSSLYFIFNTLPRKPLQIRFSYERSINRIWNDRDMNYSILVPWRRVQNMSSYTKRSTYLRVKIKHLARIM